MTQTARDDGLEVDDGGGESGAVEGLAGDIEGGEEEGRHGFTGRGCPGEAGGLLPCTERMSAGRLGGAGYVAGAVRNTGTRLEIARTMTSVMIKRAYTIRPSA